MDPKDTEQKNSGLNGHSLIQEAEKSFYQKHALVSVIAKKTEKITTAIYMVTDFVLESEPLRNRLRTLSLALLSDTRKLGARSSEPHYAFVDEIGRTIDETKALLALAATIGLVSEMNVAILTTELEKVQRDIDHHYGDKKVLVSYHPGYANILLNPAMFEVAPEQIPAPREYKGQEYDKGHEIKNNVLYKNGPINKNNDESFSKRNDLGTKIARRNDVLSVVRSKGKVSIKDVVTFLKDVSEKTVQRELHALVAEGVLLKEGEKRWSMYRLA